MERRDSVSEIYRSLSRTVYDGDYETTTTRERERGGGAQRKGWREHTETLRLPVSTAVGVQHETCALPLHGFFGKLSRGVAHSCVVLAGV